MIKIIFTILLVFNSIWHHTVSHPVHLSVTNIEYNEIGNDFEISIKLYTDDFENIINKTYGTVLNLGQENESEDSPKYILKYIQNRLDIQINKKNILNRSELIRKEHQSTENVTLLYLKAKYTGGKKVIITNSLLTDLYQDQKNLLIFTYKNTQEAFKFEKNKTNFEFYIK